MGNITGTELVRRMNVGEAKAYAMTAARTKPTEQIRKIRGGNVWLTADKTSVYKFTSLDEHN
jgi:tyrosyl-tRNA synthetase